MDCLNHVEIIRVFGRFPLPFIHICAGFYCNDTVNRVLPGCLEPHISTVMFAGSLLIGLARAMKLKKI